MAPSEIADGDWSWGLPPAGLRVGYGEGELSANLCSAGGRMMRGDRESGEVDGIELVRSTRANIGESVREAHATFVSLRKIGPSILSDGISPKPRTKTTREMPYLAYP